MTEVDWRIHGESINSCNCDIGCPCQFNSLPTQGHCRATMAVRVDEGHFGDTDLAGVLFGLLAAWPGPIHEGGGEVQPIIDSSATEEQRNAILAIMAGEHTDPGATIFNVFAAVIDTIHDPVFAPVTFECDIEERTGRFSVSGIVDLACEPIRNPVTGETHRARIDIPNGFEYTIAEVAAGTTHTGDDAAVELDWTSTHAHLNELHWTQHGVVR